MYVNADNSKTFCFKLEGNGEMFIKQKPQQMAELIRDS